jgi:zinc transport system ATP-binding protein
MTEPRELLRTEGLIVGFDGRGLLPPVDVAIRAGELWCVVGRNGSGKTTWLRTLLGLLPPVSGSVRCAGAAPRTVYVPQRSALDALYPLRARDVVRMGTERGTSVLRPAPREPPAVDASLRTLGVADLADRPFRALSEGQKQRVLLARLWASDAELALLDEPTAAMDVVAEREAFRTLGKLCRERGAAILVVSHHLGIARENAGRAIFFDRVSSTVAVGTPKEVFAHPAFRAQYGVDADG